jgi:hypothetical protein
LLEILHGRTCDKKSENLSSHVKNLIHILRINIFEDFNKSCINNSVHSESIDAASIDVVRNNVEYSATDITKEVFIDIVKDTANAADTPNKVVNDDATDISDTCDTFFKAVEIQNRKLICR